MNVIRILTQTKIKHESVFSNYKQEKYMVGALLCACSFSVWCKPVFIERQSHSQSTRGHRHRLTLLAAVRAGKVREVTELSKKDKIIMNLNMSSSVFAISITLLFPPTIATYLTLY